MSNDRSGLPGIWTAFTHLVWMEAGSAGEKVQSALAEDTEARSADVRADAR
jgi:hypothetical protein